jgi:choline dehydrogenase-like flavoprotein
MLKLMAEQYKVLSKKEVILTAGAFGSPKILLLSGIGPAAELQKHGIEVKHELPNVGQHLQDHAFLFVNAEVSAELSRKYAFESDPTAMTEARNQWAKNSTEGLLAHFNGTVTGGFLKLPGLEQLEEFKSLDDDMQKYLQDPSVPAFELAFNAPMVPPGHLLPAESGYLSTGVFLMNPLSEGHVSLNPENPEAALVIDPGYMSHALDAKVLNGAIKELMKFYESKDMKKYFKSYIHGPASASDADIDVRCSIPLLILITHT